MNLSAKDALVGIVIFAGVFLAFYGIDHFVMNSQGLPLNWNMTPAQ